MHAIVNSLDPDLGLLLSRLPKNDINGSEISVLVYTTCRECSSCEGCACFAVHGFAGANELLVAQPT